MSDIKDWADDADLNGEASPAGWPEGMPPSDVNNSAREMMAAIRRSYVRQPWYAPGGEIVRVSGTQITIKDDTKVTDYSQFYTVGQRFRVEGVEYNTTGFISSVSYEAPTTTIGFEVDAENLLPGTIKEVYVGLNYQDVQGVAGPNLLGCIIGFTEESSKIGAGLLHANGEKFSPSLYPDLAELYLIGTESDGSPKYRYGREKVGDAWWPKRPDVRGYFPRFLDNREAPAEGESDTRVDLEGPRNAGSVQQDAIINITGKFPSGEGNTPITEGGPFYRLDETYGISGGRDAKYRTGIGFDLSKATRTATETRPKNIAVVGVIVAYGGVVAGGLADISEVVEDAKLAKDLAQQTAAMVESLGSVMRYRGSVATYADLPTDENEVGDVYNVLDTGVNYAWTEEGTWDEFGNMSADWGFISGDITAQADLQEALAGKANVADIPDVPTKTSELENDSGFITADDVPEPDLTGVLKNTATASGAYAIGGSATSTGALALGYNAQTSGKYSTSVGANSSATAQYATGIGYNADALVPYAVQIGPGSNTSANTMNVGLSSSLNVQLLDAKGKIPAERLPEDIGGGASSLEDIAVAGNGITFTKPIIHNNIASADINGSPTISAEGLLTNVTGSNYLHLTNNSIANYDSGRFFRASYDWEITCKFKTPATKTKSCLFRIEPSGSLVLWCAYNNDSVTGNIYVHLATTSGAIDVTGATALDLDTWYTMRLSRDTAAGQYKLELAKEGEALKVDATTSSTSNLSYYSEYPIDITYVGSGMVGVTYDMKEFSVVSNYGSGINWTAYEYDADKTAVSANVDLTGYLKNTSSSGSGLQIRGKDSSAQITMDDYNIAIGGGSSVSANSSNTNSVAIGRKAKTTDFYSVAIGNEATAKGGVAIGDDATTTGDASVALCGTANYGAVSIGKYSQSASYGVSIGYSAISSGSYAIQLGQGTNSTANTMNVGLSSSLNVRLLDANGKIPAERLPEGIGGGSGAPATNTGTALVLAASQTEYEAPADGYFAFYALYQSGADAYVSLHNMTTPYSILGSEWFWYGSKGAARLSCPVRKGQKVAVDYNCTMKNIYFYFIPTGGDS